MYTKRLLLALLFVGSLSAVASVASETVTIQLFYGYDSITKVELGRPRSELKTLVALDPLPPVVCPSQSILELTSLVDTAADPVWYHNGVKVDGNQRIRVTGTTLRIENVMAGDAGGYRTATI